MNIKNRKIPIRQARGGRPFTVIPAKAGISRRSTGFPLSRE